MGNIKKVDRTVLKLYGEFPERKARQIFERVAGDRMVSMKCFYDKEEDETTILLYPCRTYNMSGECDGKNADEKHIRTIRVLGALPDYVDIVKTYWNPIRARAKAAKDPMRWVTMYPARATDDTTKAVYTELSFIVDSRCKKGYEDEALNKAVGQIRESLRLIASDIKGDLMASARLTEDVSMDFVDELHKLEDDEVQEKYRKLGLRHVNADELVTQE